MVLRRIFEPKREEVIGEQRKLHNELNDLYSSRNIIQVIKSRTVRRAGNVACMGERRGVYRVVLVGKPDGTNHLEDPGVDGRITLRWIFR
jgi:hypothetical protein